jgi:hypothetical protein
MILKAISQVRNYCPKRERFSFRLQLNKIIYLTTYGINYYATIAILVGDFEPDIAEMILH